MDKENKLCEIQEEIENKVNNTIFNTPVRFGRERNTNSKKTDFERHRPYKTHLTTPSPKLRAIKTTYDHLTPSPKPRTTFINPFDAGLTKCLHLSVLSPSVFTHVISPSQDPTFWRIEDVSLIKPVPIEENPIEQFEHLESEENDADIQEAIKSYFLTSQIVPSPCEPLPKVENENLLHFQKQDEKNKTENPDLNDSLKETKNSSSQTELTLPPVLPSELEKALKPYFTYNQDQQDSEEGNLNNSSLRRKLLFGQIEDCEDMSICYDEKQETPLKSGRMITPVRFSNFRHFRGLESSPKEGFKKRTYGTPLQGVSSPETSPIVFRNEIRMQMTSTAASSSTSFVRTLDFEEDEVRTKMNNKPNDNDMSIVMQENTVQDQEPMNMMNTTTLAISNNGPSVSYETGHSHNMAGFLSTQMQSHDTGYSSSISNSIQQGHIESTDLTWKLSSHIFSSTPTK